MIRARVTLGNALVAIAAAAIALSMNAQNLRSHGNDLAATLRIGQHSIARHCVQPDVPDAPMSPGWGHDGQSFYVIAREFPHESTAIECLDRPQYRIRRILYPMLAAPFGSGRSLVYALVAINLLSIAAAAWAVARLARSIGSHPAAGLVVGFAPAFFLSLTLSLADALASALALWGVVMWRERHPRRAVMWFTLGALARETSLIAVVACGLSLVVGLYAKRATDDRFRRPSRDHLAAIVQRALPLTVPLATIAVWTLIVRDWIPEKGSTAAGQFAAPFSAFAQVGWQSPPTSMALLLLLGTVYGIVRTWRTMPELCAWAIIEFALLICTATQVVNDALNMSRVIGMSLPLLTVAALQGAGANRRSRSAVPALAGGSTSA